jgi:hypothetical protein
MVETTLGGVERLEVSYLEGSLPEKRPTASEIQVVHRRGQTMIVFREPALATIPDFQTGQEVADYGTQLAQEYPGTTIRIWRSNQRIDRGGLATARLIGECELLSVWNDHYYQDDTGRQPPVRYRVRDNGPPLDWGTGLYAHHPVTAGPAYYAVSVAVAGEEDLDALTTANCTTEPVTETVGLGAPILQWIERPDPEQGWHYRRGRIARLIYTRWEPAPHSSTPNNPIDYLVVIPLEPRGDQPDREPEYRAWRVDPAPVGLHLHCWGGSCNGGYGWWYNAHRGAVLIASNQIPYDWWTGYHSSRGTRKTFGDGPVQPYTMDRTFGFLDWAAQQWKEAPEDVRDLWPRLDLKRVFTAGNSMGGSGAPMFAIRYADRIAWGLGWVGVHVPELSPQFANSYRGAYGPREKSITMPDGRTSPWDFYSDAWWLNQNVGTDTGMIIASNGKNDGGIGWQQAWQFARALQQTRRPHIFNWGMNGHGTRTIVGSNFELDVRTDQSLPAFTHCSLDDDIGNGDPQTGDATGQYNAHLRWKTEDIVDTVDRWEITVLLGDSAPQPACTVHITPRRCQRFRPPPGSQWAWTSTSVNDGMVQQQGDVTADRWGLVTIEEVHLTQTGCRISVAPLSR